MFLTTVSGPAPTSLIPAVVTLTSPALLNVRVAPAADPEVKPSLNVVAFVPVVAAVVIVSGWLSLTAFGNATAALAATLRV